MATHSRNRCVVWNSRRESHLGSGHVRPRQQTGHMIASDLIRAAAKTLVSRGPSTYGSRWRSTQPTLRSSEGPLLRPTTQVVDDALLAQRTTRHASVAAVQDQPVVGVQL